MLLLKIVNKSFFLHKLATYDYTKNLFRNIKILKFVKKESFSFFVRSLVLLIVANIYNLKMKTSYFISHIYFSCFNNQKLISYVININIFTTNTLINVNSIKGDPKIFYSAGMFKLQKKQKTRQPKAIFTILRALLLKSKNFKTKPVAVHFNNLFFNYQSYILKKLKQKIFAKLIISYIYRPHNGCRLRKKKRIKIRTRAK
jgi:ribosomal protein S11